MRQIDNASFVMLDLEFDDKKEAEAFAAKLRNLWVSAQGQKLMQFPQLRIADPIESKEL
jgi:hypothetical protein